MNIKHILFVTIGGFIFLPGCFSVDSYYPKIYNTTVTVIKKAGTPTVRMAGKPLVMPAKYLIDTSGNDTDGPYIYNGFKDSKGNLWFGTDSGIICYDGTNFLLYSTAQGIPEKIYSISEDNDGNMWFGTIKGAYRYDGKSIYIYTTVQGLNNNRILSILKDKKGNMWFGTLNGATCFDGKNFITYQIPGNITNHVTCITQDKNGNMWFGTVGLSAGGVCMYNGKYFSVLDDLPYTDAIQNLVEDNKGTMWYGTGAGLDHYYDHKITRYDNFMGKVTANDIFSMLKDSQGNIWIGINGGVCMYDGKKFNTVIEFDNPDDLVSCILEDDRGNMWFGRGNGTLIKYNESTNKEVTYKVY